MGLAGTVIGVIVMLAFGKDYLGVTKSANPASRSTSTEGAAEYKPTAAEEELVSFVSFVFDDAQKTWARVLPTAGTQYRKAKMVIFTDRGESACGMQSAAVGPFYCPADDKVYIDLGFYQTLKDRLGAGGDFAQAYVIAHEIGHHVQNIIGVNRRAAQGSAADPSRKNELSVRQELQADCFAGIWAHGTAQRDLLEAGDIEEGMNAARAIGDDTLQKGAGRAVQPESWTHGSSAQRMRWFRRGLKHGTVAACDTFSATDL